MNGTAFKASAGLAEHSAIRVVASPQAAIEELKSAGYTIYLALLEGEDARVSAFTMPLCIVIGNEAIGTQKHCTKRERQLLCLKNLRTFLTMLLSQQDYFCF